MAMKKVRIALAFTIIAGLLVWLTISASNENLQYYVDIKDLKAMGVAAHDTGIRVKGKLEKLPPPTNSLDYKFIIAQDGHELEVHYNNELPDTFKLGSEVLVEGEYHPEGYFTATMLMAKCPSKYETTDEYSTPYSSQLDQGLKGTN